MPNITVIREHLFEAIGKSYTDKEFDELCFEFGVEVDDVETEVIEFTADGTKEEHVVYVIAIPANRYLFVSVYYMILNPRYNCI